MAGRILRRGAILDVLKSTECANAIQRRRRLTAGGYVSHLQSAEGRRNVTPPSHTAECGSTQDLSQPSCARGGGVGGPSHATVVGPRWSSIRMGSVGVVGAAGIGNAMTPTGSASGTAVSWAGDAAACTQRRSRLATTPSAIATAATGRARLLA